MIEPRRGDTEYWQSIRARLLTVLSPLRGSANLTQLVPKARKASPLGLTLTAAPQLVEGSRLISSGCDRIETTVAGPRCPTPTGWLSCRWLHQLCDSQRQITTLAKSACGHPCRRL